MSSDVLHLPVPLNYWVEGKYPEVMARTGWSKAKSRRKVHQALRRLGFSPVTDQDFEDLRQRGLKGTLLDHDLY